MKNSKKSQIRFLITCILLFFGIGIPISFLGNVYLIFAILAFATLNLVIMIYLLKYAKKKLFAILIDLLSIGIGVAFFFVLLIDYGTIDDLGDFLSIIVNTLSFPCIFFIVILLFALIGSCIGPYFTPNATCAVCGKKTGLNRYKVAKATDGSYIWQCKDCAKRNNGKLLKINMDTGKAEVVPTQDTEVKVKCNTCGHLYCYNLSDLQKNLQLAKGAVVDGVLGVTEAIGGTRIGSQVANARAERKLNQVVDYSRCPHCHSTDVRTISKEEWNAEKAKHNSAVISSADELKKYKELLDMGVITQEEFDAKKKQLLGL